MLLPLEVFAALSAEEWTLRLLPKVGVLDMFGQSFLSGVRLGATRNLAAVHWIVCVLDAVALQMLLPGERLGAVRTLVHPFHLFSTRISFHFPVVEVSLRSLV